MSADLVVRGRRVVTAEGTRPAAVHVREGRIARVTGLDEICSDTRVVDAGDDLVMPGVVDTHVHVNEPGRTAWEGFATATRAAAAGGVTTLIDMPLNSVPATTTVEALRAKQDAARGQVSVDVGFWGGVVPGNAADVPPLCEAGVRGFKCFLVPSGVDEFPAVGEHDLRAALPAIARRGLPLLVHAELPGPIERAAGGLTGADVRRHSTWMRSRPPEAETEAIAMLIRLAREFGAWVHIVHVSAAEALASIRAARREAVRVTAETCPHYLTFASEEIPDGAVEFKCAPPIRTIANREALWQGVFDGDLDLVATDHSPCPPALKCPDRGDFFEAWGGIASLQLGLAATWTALARRGGTIDRLAQLMCGAPARLAGLSSRKGTLAPGADADLVIWDPDAAFAVRPEDLRHRHTISPYAGMTLRGVVHKTFVRGQLAYDEGVGQDNGGCLL